MAEADEVDREKNYSQGQFFTATLLILNTVAILGVAYFQLKMYREQKQESPSIQDIVASAAQENKKLSGRAQELEGILLALDGFTANLAQGDGPRRFVRLNLVLKFSKDSKDEEFRARKPQIRDTIINILNSKRAEDLLKVEGKNYLKEEIKSAINSFLLNGHIMDVFYIGFQIN